VGQICNNMPSSIQSTLCRARNSCYPLKTSLAFRCKPVAKFLLSTVHDRSPGLNRSSCVACSFADVTSIVTLLQLPHPGLAAGFTFNTAVFIAGIQVLLAGLTPAGVLSSWLLGGSIFSAFGWAGYLLVCVYFILGSAATKFRLREKENKGIAEKRSGRRGPVCPRCTISFYKHM
jgi:hypothetical protein